MFESIESDDFDQVLSQFDFPEVDKEKPQDMAIPSTESCSQDVIACTNESKIGAVKIKKVSTISNNVLMTSNISHQPKKSNEEKQLSPKVITKNEIPKYSDHSTSITDNRQKLPQESLKTLELNIHEVDNFVSPKHLKRKIINSHFDQQSKRKFPGPAGLLTGALEETKDESIGHIEFLSQDMDFTESNLHRDIFESPLWKQLLSDTQAWNLHNVDSIKAIKQQALAGNLRRRKAQTVTAFIEAVDRSVTDPLIILRDESGSIKCTLHRDAWSTFSPYIVSEYCALVLQKPTVLTTGGAFKKHYLNITLNNIFAIFSSAVLKEDMVLPDGCKIIYEEDFTVIKTENCSENTETPTNPNNGAEDLFDGLDNFFSDEIF